MKGSCGLTQAPMKMSAEDKAREERYQAEDDMRTLGRFHEIHQDKGRVKRLHEHIARQGKMLGVLRGRGGKAR